MTTDLLRESLRRLPAAPLGSRYKHPLRGPRFQPRRYVIHLHDLPPAIRRQVATNPNASTS